MDAPRLVLVNGAPGSGKSTVAAELARDVPLMLALDIDTIKYALGQWDLDRSAAGLQARRLAVAVVREQLRSGHSVVLGQYLARTEFIDELEAVARDERARFCEFVLQMDEATLAERLGGRHARPDRPEHAVTNRLVGPADAPALVGSVEALRPRRPVAVWIDATGTPADTLAQLRSFLVSQGN